MGIHVQRARVRQSVARTDPIRRKVRWHQVLSRRSYSVPGSNALWHIDGHHSLIGWRFVIHGGGVDGYSGMIVYLQCSTNNKSLTTFGEQPVNAVYHHVSDLTKVEKMLWCVISWFLREE